MSAESASAVHKGQVDLVDFIDWSGVECLNQSSTHPIPNPLKQGQREDDGLHLESDADEQLLLYIPFTQVVKLYSIVINGPEEEGIHQNFPSICLKALFNLLLLYYASLKWTCALELFC